MEKEPPIIDRPSQVIGAEKKRWWKLIPPLAVIILVSLVVFIAQYEPVANQQYYPQCGFKKATGYDCPGCGGLRATHAIANGRVIKAFRFHPGFVLSLPIVGYLFILWVRDWQRTGEMPVPLVQPECNLPLIWIAVLFLSLGIARNIPTAPFTWLTIPAIEAR